VGGKRLAISGLFLTEERHMVLLEKIERFFRDVDALERGKECCHPGILFHLGKDIDIVFLDLGRRLDHGFTGEQTVIAGNFQVGRNRFFWAEVVSGGLYEAPCAKPSASSEGKRISPFQLNGLKVL
jgi:hypothetical protein